MESKGEALASEVQAEGNTINIDTLVMELTAVVNERVGTGLSWYKTHSHWPRWVLRSSGTVVIALSISLPYITSLNTWVHKDEVVAGIAVCLALLSSLNSFYGWNLMWQKRLETQYILEYLLAQWRVALLDARCERPTIAREKIVNATKVWLQEAQKATSGETAQFFQSVRWPNTKT